MCTKEKIREMTLREFNEKELECGECELLDELCPGGWSSGGGGEPLEPPCSGWYRYDEDTLMGEIFSKELGFPFEEEERYEARQKRENQRKRKNQLAGYKRRQTNSELSSYNDQIKRLEAMMDSVRRTSAVNRVFTHFSHGLSGENKKDHEARKEKAERQLKMLEKKKEKVEEEKAKRHKEVLAKRKEREINLVKSKVICRHCTYFNRFASECRHYQKPRLEEETCYKFEKSKYW